MIREMALGLCFCELEANGSRGRIMSKGGLHSLCMPFAESGLLGISKVNFHISIPFRVSPSVVGLTWNWRQLATQV